MQLDALEDILPGLLPRSAALALHQLPFERLEERFCHGVVERRSRPRYRSRGSVRAEAALERLRCVLDALVVMEDEASVVWGPRVRWLARSRLS